MKRKSIAILLSILLICINNINVLASTGLQEVKGFNVSGEYTNIDDLAAVVPTTLCHCGGTRQQTYYLKGQTEPCPSHGAGCNDYTVAYIRDYYYCSNPYCGDNWYSAWRVYSTNHY